MIQLLFDTAAQTVKLTSPSVIKVGADVPVTITFSAAPGTVSALSLALGTDATTPEILAFTETFAEESETVQTAVLDANDTRLVDFMAAKGTTTVKLEVVAVIDGVRVVTPNLDVAVQKAIITGDPTSEGGPDYYTAAQIDAMLGRHDLQELAGTVALDRDNGASQYGYMTATTSFDPPSNGGEGQELTVTFYTTGGAWDLDFHANIQMSAAARALLPITLENNRSYVLKLAVAGFLWTLQEIYGPTAVD